MLYRIIGADGKEYGPITTEVLRQWVAQGRANAQTRALSENSTAWQPLGVMPEFANAFPTVAQPPPGFAPPIAGAVRKTNGFATAGLIFGILSFACCFKLLFGTLGIIFSLIALSKINRNPELYEGRGIAIGGLILSIIGIISGLALILFLLTTGHFHAYSNWNVNQFAQ